MKVFQYIGHLCDIPYHLDKFFISWMEGSTWDAIFLIKGNEVVVRVGDYLVYKNKELSYFPKEIWECRER